MAFAISKVFSLVPSISRFTLANHRKTKIVFGCIALGILLITLVIPLANPLVSKFNLFPPSRMTEYEYKTAVWLRENTRETDLIVSDYWTMMLLNPISNKIWLTDRQFMASSLGPESQNLLNQFKNRVFGANNSLEANQVLQNITDQISDEIDWTEKYYMDYIGLTPKNV